MFSSFVLQLGSYFGSVLCSVDVNRDSLTDVLLVGSPMYMGSHKNEEGRVYMFSLNEVKYLFTQCDIYLTI